MVQLVEHWTSKPREGRPEFIFAYVYAQVLRDIWGPCQGCGFDRLGQISPTAIYLVPPLRPRAIEVRIRWVVWGTEARIRIPARPDFFGWKPLYRVEGLAAFVFDGSLQFGGIFGDSSMGV